MLVGIGVLAFCDVEGPNVLLEDLEPAARMDRAWKKDRGARRVTCNLLSNGTSNGRISYEEEAPLEPGSVEAKCLRVSKSVTWESTSVTSTLEISESLVYILISNDATI
jgi:hypothetical protein